MRAPIGMQGVVALIDRRGRDKAHLPVEPRRHPAETRGAHPRVSAVVHLDRNGAFPEC